MAFGLIRTIVGAWNAGVTGAAANRMITRHRVSLIFPIPLPYRNEIARVPGVTAVSWANWFGGVYGEPNDFKNFWPRFAVDGHVLRSLSRVPAAAGPAGRVQEGAQRLRHRPQAGAAARLQARRRHHNGRGYLSRKLAVGGARDLHRSGPVDG